MDRFDRIFELNRIFQSARYPVSRQRLEEELECSRATVKRLIEEMRLYLNAPVVYDRKRNGYHYDAAEGEMYQLPGLWFNASELQALLTVQQLLAEIQPGLLESHLQPLRRKIDQLLSRQPGQVEPISRHIRLLRAAARPAGPYLTQLASALAARHRVSLKYYNRGSDKVTEREVSPQRLTLYRDNWYLDAWCHLREGLRTFALDAISEVRESDQAAVELQSEQLDAHFSEAYGIFSGSASHQAVLRFTRHRARWVAKESWHPQQQSRWLEDGRYELVLPYAHTAELIMDLMRYGAEVEVVSPPELRAEIADRLRQAVAQYDADQTESDA
ncbi:MAG: transcriptional regulator [Candidatus Thiodiazotropha lotti]|uniref:Transcriptional regulator n=1 Tax=Candidatus Thiodiazotropha lotti TaxID=2792787 RepID=A0A9E4K6G8_9GAMM|nr:transcriptional regulator [Candidatus Thiodiazotropha lotti]ODB98818.1 transcriptional regulator [Candidatus Thiodiazotropha endoloripes]MCG7921881.1 transcriptional regulator [Candidatus Thiodiazotropha lotti]MCG7932373.1 transcriptional regulator [Candidatus Thiodiazotropha lotti]MCG7940467.1 transcriptional regulator [Candidatus Thiodiazotropha lotti]